MEDFPRALETIPELTVDDVLKIIGAVGNSPRKSAIYLSVTEDPSKDSEIRHAFNAAFNLKNADNIGLKKAGDVRNNLNGDFFEDLGLLRKTSIDITPLYEKTTLGFVLGDPIALMSLETSILEYTGTSHKIWGRFKEQNGFYPQQTSFLLLNWLRQKGNGRNIEFLREVNGIEYVLKDGEVNQEYKNANDRLVGNIHRLVEAGLIHYESRDPEIPISYKALASVEAIDFDRGTFPSKRYGINLDKIEKLITLVQKEELSAQQIAKELGVSYVIASKTSKALVEDGILVATKGRSLDEFSYIKMKDEGYAFMDAMDPMMEMLGLTQAISKSGLTTAVLNEKVNLDMDKLLEYRTQKLSLDYRPNLQNITHSALSNYKEEISRN